MNRGGYGRQSQSGEVVKWWEDRERDNSGVPALTTSANKAASSQLPPPSCQLSFDGHGD